MKWVAGERPITQSVGLSVLGRGELSIRLRAAGVLERRIDAYSL